MVLFNRGRDAPQNKKGVIYVLSRTEAAKRLSVSLSTFDRMARDGEFPVVRIGRLVRVEEAALNRWIAAKAGRANNDD